MDIGVIGDEDTILGFELAGVKKAKVFDKDKIKQDLKEFEDCKILIITEEVSPYVKDMKPTVVTISGKKGGKGSLEELSKIYKSTIGVALKEDD